MDPPSHTGLFAFMLVSLLTHTTLFRSGLMPPTKMISCVITHMAYTIIEMVSCVVHVKMDMLFLYIPTL